MRTAIFGGSFNPIHKGHIGLAQAILDQNLADELWFMVSPQNPLKRQEGLLDEACRLELAQLAVQNLPGMVASDFEFHLPRPSYTWKTLEALCARYPDRRFSLVIGGDNWAIFPKWAHYEELMANYPLIIYPREGSPICAADLPPTARLVDAPLFPWSSTQVREAIAAGTAVEDMLPDAVLQLIRERNYYR